MFRQVGGLPKVWEAVEHLRGVQYKQNVCNISGCCWYLQDFLSALSEQASWLALVEAYSPGSYILPRAPHKFVASEKSNCEYPKTSVLSVTTGECSCYDLWLSVANDLILASRVYSVVSVYPKYVASSVRGIELVLLLAIIGGAAQPAVGIWTASAAAAYSPDPACIDLERTRRHKDMTSSKPV
jgi:hypothetical protein